MEIIQSKTTGAFVIQIDKEAFLAEVQKIVDLSPTFKEFNDVKALKWPEDLVPPRLWNSLQELQELVQAVCAAVETAKVGIITKADPDGSKGLKFDRTLALQTAADLVDAGIKLNGWLGPVVKKLWRPLLNVLISVWVAGQPTNWVAVALAILRIVEA